MILNEQATPQDISFFENLIRLEELTGKVYSDNIQPDSPNVQSVGTTASSLLANINNGFTNLSEIGQNELKSNQDLYGSIVGTNAATLQLLGDQIYSGARNAITGFLGKLDNIANFTGDQTETPETPETETPADTGTDTGAAAAAASGGAVASTTAEPETTTTNQEKPTPEEITATNDQKSFTNLPTTRYLPKQPVPKSQALQTGGPTYFIRTGPGRYQPASQADLSSGTQLFMKNPNPALRMVYPYVKVESMIKKARRATRA